MKTKPIEEMTAAEIAEEKRRLTAWLAELSPEGGYSLAALRRAYDELVNETHEDQDAEAGTKGEVEYIDSETGEKLTEFEPGRKYRIKARRVLRDVRLENPE